MKKKVYLDYSATTMVDNNVLEKFNNVVKDCYANPNSIHDLGLKSNSIIDKSISNICSYFNVDKDEIIFTSGSSESNNTVIKGIIEGSKRKKIITTYLEHSSILSPLSYLQSKGYIVEFVKLNNNGLVDIEDLRSKLDGNTLLVSICLVNSELGIILNTKEVFEVVKDYDKEIYTHSDITQGLGKVNINLDNIDMASFSGHKIFTFKGIGGLIKKKNIKIVPLIHGGKSTTLYRSGTPSTEFIYSLSCAFDLFKNSIDVKYNYVKELNNRIRNVLKGYDNICINSTGDSIPHILNFSIIGKSSNGVQKYFNDKGIYISTKSACSSDKNISMAVKNMYNEERALSSVRVSISYKTTSEEIDYFIDVLKEYMSNENS